MDLVLPNFPTGRCSSDGKESGQATDDLKSVSMCSTTLCMPISSGKSEISQTCRFSRRRSLGTELSFQSSRVFDSPAYSLDGTNVAGSAPSSPTDATRLKRPSFTTVPPPSIPLYPTQETERNKELLRFLLNSDRLRFLKDSLPSRSTHHSASRRPFKEVLKKRISKHGLVRKVSSYWRSSLNTCPVIFKRTGVDSQSGVNAHFVVQDLLKNRGTGTDPSQDDESVSVSDFEQ